jgi:Ca2+-binding RTX toxin-like protein
MATYDLNRGQLNALLASDGNDPSIRKGVIDYLITDGDVGKNGKVAVEVSDGTSPLDPNAKVLILETSSPTSVNTDVDPFKVIVDTDGAPLTVTGSKGVFVALGGSDSLDAGGATGNVTVMTGADDHDFDFGAGPHGGFDTMFGGLGVEDNGSKAGGGGDDSLFGGSGNDTFIIGKIGNATISGGGGNDSVMFDDSSTNAAITTSGGVTTVMFSDTGQKITIGSDVENLVFTDHK